MPTVADNPDFDSKGERLVSAAPVEDDSSFELKLRPQRLGGIHRAEQGQRKPGGRHRGGQLARRSHGSRPALRAAGPGQDDAGQHHRQRTGRRTSSRRPRPLLQIKGDLTAILTNLQEKQVLFIDEVHRLQPALEEILYSALEDYKLDIIIGQGPSARTHTMDVKPFTFVGATTRAGLLSAPLRSRFGIVLRLEFYTHEDLRIIVERSAEILGVAIDDAGCE